MNDTTDSGFERQKVAKGRRIFKEGDPGDYAYIVEMGEVGIYKHIDGTEVELTTLNPGEIFGEVAVLDGRERMASAIALMDSTLIVVSPEALEQRIKGADKFVKTLLSIHMTNLRDTHHTYKNPEQSIEGHLRALTRHLNQLRDLSEMTKREDFIEEIQPVLSELRRGCDKLYKVSEKYRQELET